MYRCKGYRVPDKDEEEMLGPMPGEQHGSFCNLAGKVVVDGGEKTGEAQGWCWECGQLLGMKSGDPIGGVSPTRLVGLLRLGMEANCGEQPERERPPVVT